MLALDEEERMGRWSESDGPKDQIAQVKAMVFPCMVYFLSFQTLRDPCNTMAKLDKALVDMVEKGILIRVLTTITLGLLNFY